MSFTTEDLGKNTVKLTIEVGADEFEKACERSYLKNRSKIRMPGFRPGKAPRALIEKTYGPGVFFEDAANELIDAEYPKVAEESGLEIVSRPDIEVTQAEKGKTFIFTATVAVKPEVELGQYKGVEVDKVTVEVTDEEVNAEIDKVREQNSRLVTVDDRAVLDGDIVNIDYSGSVDGEIFEGGTAQGQDLTIGSHSFIDTFEDQIIGKNIGDEFDVNVTFPEQYHAENLAGKPAVFKVKLNGIKVKELPEADDDFATEVSDFDTMDEYRADVRKGIEEKKNKEVRAAKEDAVITKIVESSKMEIPQGMIDLQKERMAEDFAQRLQYQGLSIEQYLKFTGMTAKQFLDDLEPRAVANIKSRLVLEAVAKAENIEVTDEDIEKEYQDMATRYNMDIEKVKELIDDKAKETMRMDIAVEKAATLVADAAVEVEK
ncbi:MAG: trigger factor [Lachnospiraceae bacterium]|nr:trigger factor [Lachnospiraceae bacterium]